jgi:peptide/nickel transport system substrate-binding protein
MGYDAEDFHENAIRQYCEGRLTRRDFIVRLAVLGLGSSAIVATLASCGGGGNGAATSASAASTLAPGSGKEIAQAVSAITADIAGFDYVVAYDLNTNVPVYNVIEGLFRPDVNGTPMPGLALSQDVSNPLKCVYKLRPNVTFHDGSPVTSDDVAFSLQRNMDPNVGSYLGSFFSRVKSIAATAADEVTVTFSKPDGTWYLVSGIPGATGVTSKSWIEKNGKKVGTPEAGILGTGPYKFKSWVRGQQIVLERYDQYWNAANRAMKVKEWVIRPVVDESTIVAALGTGEIDHTFNLSGTGFKLLKAFPNVKQYTAPSYNVAYLGFNCEKAPWSDKRVRQAFSWALDKPGILDAAYAGFGKMCKSPITPDQCIFETDQFKAAYDALPAYAPGDISKAKALVQEAGATGAKGQVLVGNDYDVPAGIAVQYAAQQMGMNVSVQRMPQQQKFALEFSGKPRPYDMTITIWGSDFADPAGNMQNCLGPNDVLNAVQYHNPAVERLIEQQKSTTNQAERTKYIIEAQKIIVDDQPWVVLYETDTLQAMNNRLAGYALRPLYYWDSWGADIYGV